MNQHLDGVLAASLILATGTAWVAALALALVAMTVMQIASKGRADARFPHAMTMARRAFLVLGGGVLARVGAQSSPELYRSLTGRLPGDPACVRLPSRRRVAWILIGFAAAALVVLAFPAQAQPGQVGVGVLDDTQNFYVEQARGIEQVLRQYARYLFGILATISFALFAYKNHLLLEGNLAAFGGKFALELLKVGFFFWVLTDGPAFVMQFLGYFTDAGQRAGQTGPLSPSWIAIHGFDTCFRIIDAIAEMGMMDRAAYALILFLVGIAILGAFAWIAIQLLILTIEIHLIVYGGVILLGFGGLSHTRDIPKNYLSYALSAGVQLFTLYVIVGLGMQLAQHWPAAIQLGNGEDVLRTSLFILVSAAGFLALALKIPKVASSLVTGAVNLSAGDAITPALAAGGAAATGAVLATAATGGVAAAAKGGVQAMTAGTELATASGATGVKALAQGVGHAARATGSEAVAGLRSGAGLGPRSPNASDTRGRDISNFGTRAANALTTEKQALAESTPKATGPGIPGARVSGAATPAAAGSGTSGAAGTATPGAAGTAGAAGSAGTTGTAGASAKPAGASITPTATGSSSQGPQGKPQGPEDFAEDGKHQATEAGAPMRNIAPPQVPDDSAPAAVPPIRFDDDN